MSCILCGQVGIAGSLTIGDYVTLGGRVAVRDHVSIVSKVRLAAISCVTKDIKEPGDYGGFPELRGFQDVTSGTSEGRSMQSTICRITKFLFLQSWTSSFPTDHSYGFRLRSLHAAFLFFVLLLFCLCTFSASVLLFCYFIIFCLIHAISVWALESSEAPLALAVESLEQEEANEGHFAKKCSMRYIGFMC